jgi:ribosome modulation factor
METVIERVKPPRIALNLIPRMQVGMGTEAAYKHGYRAGYQGVNRVSSCTLKDGGDERREWMRGFKEGEKDRLGN